MNLKLESNAESLNNCVKAMLSDTVIKAAESTIKRELEAFGAQLEKDWTGEVSMPKLDTTYDYQGLRVMVYTESDEKLYDKLMASEHTAISSIDQINCSYTITQVLVDYGITLDITMQYKCPLPPEDLQVLYMLGKIETHTSNNSYSSTSVVCRF